MVVKKWMVYGLVAVIGVTAIVSFNKYRSRKKAEEIKNQKLREAEGVATPTEPAIKPSTPQDLIFGFPPFMSGPVNFM
jgi:hypothetical protein